MRRYLFLPAAGILALALGACGGTTDGAPAEEERPESRLQLALGPVYEMGSNPMAGDDSAWMKEQEARDRKREEAIAKCMAEQGFDYAPVVYSYEQGISLEEDDRTPLEIAEQEGFGFFTESPDRWNGASSTAEDPNQAELEKMSETERKAWEEALWGPPIEVAQGEEYEYNWETAGCVGKADHGLQTDEAEDDPIMALYTDPQWAELSDGMDRIWEKAQSSAEMGTLQKEYSQCMADEGVPGISSMDAIFEQLRKMQEELYKDLPEPTPEQLEDPNFVYPEPDPAKKKEFREKEIKMAVADVTCQEKTDYSNRQWAIYNKFEDQFYDENKAQIDSFVAWAMSQKKG